MPYEPLHHKYRPQTFAELVGQGAIAQTLTNALRQERIAPAYLFTGARGTGKTSSARIFAKSLNCLKGDVPTAQPCGVCEVCRTIANGSALDIIEIDAASNTGVDNIRELIERSQFAPVQCRYKVYVVDECHMLSTAAFNALLKTLEEPPDRVVFILATTDPQKVLPTIISRCQRFDFRRIDLEAMVQHLGMIAQTEAIDIAPEATQLVAQIAQGGLRDAESLLDQLSLLEGQITIERVWDLVGAVPERELLELVLAIAQDSPSALVDKTRHLMDRGREPLIVLQNLAGFYRDLLIAKTARDRADLVAITASTWAQMCEFVQSIDIGWILAGQKHLRASEVQIKTTSQPRLWLEVTLMGLLPSAITPPGELHRIAEANPEPRSSLRAPLQTPSPTTQPAAIYQKPPTAPTTQSNPPTALPPSSTALVAEEVVASPEQFESVQAEGQSAKVPHPTPIANVVPNAVPVAADGVDLQRTWQQIIEHLHPLSKGLLKEHGRLLALREQQAEISISSQNLFKIAQSKLPDVEGAFQKVLDRKIKVALVVAVAPPAEVQPPPNVDPTESFSPKLKTGETETITPSGELPRIAKSPPPPSYRSDANATKPVVVEPTQAITPEGERGEVVPPLTVPLPTTAPPSQEMSSTIPAAWQDEDDVVKAAKSFAQMFNGQIVNLDSSANGSQAAGTLSLEEPILPDDSLDSDVPF